MRPDAPNYRSRPAGTRGHRGGCTARTARQILNALNLDDRWGFTRARAATTTTDLCITPVSTRELVTILRATRMTIKNCTCQV
jgi:hypothetical protein